LLREYRHFATGIPPFCYGNTAIVRGSKKWSETAFQCALTRPGKKSLDTTRPGKKSLDTVGILGILAGEKKISPSSFFFAEGEKEKKKVEFFQKKRKL